MRREWRTTTLAELGPIFNGNSISETYKDAHFRGVSNGTVYIGTKEVGFDHRINYDTDIKIPPSKTKNFKLAPPNTVLVCAEGGSAGRKIGITDRNVFFGNKLYAICPSGAISNRFVFYHCLTEQFARSFKGAMAGLIGGVSLNKFKRLPIILPPLAEQKRIVTVLDEAFAGLATAVAHAEKNCKNARELFDSYLNSVFAKKGQGWIVSTIGGALDNGLIFAPQDGNHGEIHPKKADYVEQGVPFIMASDLQNGEVNCIDCKFIGEKTAAGLRKGFAKDGDILLSHKGTIGRVAILRTDSKFVVLTPQVTYYRVKNTEVLSSRFLRFVFESAAFQAEMAHIAGAGSTRAYIGITRQLELSISYPPLAEQRALVKALDELKETTSRLESAYSQKLISLAQLKQSVLQKAFSGELTSPPSQAIEEAAE